MIIAFADNSTARVFDSLSQIPDYCESTDVERGVFVFLNEFGGVLKPTFAEPSRREKIAGATKITIGSYSLVPTSDVRHDLLENLARGTVEIEAGPTSIRSLADLRRVAPALLDRTLLAS